MILKKTALKIINTGTEGMSLSEKRIIRLINTICSICLLTAIVACFSMQVFIGFRLVTLLFVLYHIFCYGLTIYLNYRKKHIWSKWALVYICNQIMLTMHGTNPYATSSWIVLLGLYALYVALFNDIKTIISISFVTTILMSIYIYTQSLPTHESSVFYSESEIRIKHIISFMTSGIFILLLTFFIKNNLIEYQHQLEQALDEKEILLKEVHHRVKNNLQLISSLLNFQERRLSRENSLFKEAMDQSQSRIQSIALIHHLLYENEDLSTVSTQMYIEKLMREISNIFDPEKKVELFIHCDNIYLSLEQTLSVGMIINESVTNSFKYAFSKIENPKINIECNQTENNKIKFIISDNGYPSEANIKNSKGIGVHIIKDMVNSLEGTLNINTNHGFKYVIFFTLKVTK